MITHISLDVWNTILLPNQDFEQNVVKYLAEQTELSADIINSIYRKTSSFFDGRAVVDQIAPTTEYVWNMFFQELKWYIDRKHLTFKRPNTTAVIEHINQLFIDYPPKIAAWFYNIVDDLYNNHNTTHLTWSIIANTTFISGAIIDAFIQDNIGENKPIVSIYSDVWGYTKPSTMLYEVMWEQVTEYYSSNQFATLNKEHTIHIGTHLESDGIGALKFGFNAKIVNGPSEVYDVIHDITNL